MDIIFGDVYYDDPETGEMVWVEYCTQEQFHKRYGGEHYIFVVE